MTANETTILAIVLALQEVAAVLYVKVCRESAMSAQAIKNEVLELRNNSAAAVAGPMFVSPATYDRLTAEVEKALGVFAAIVETKL
jgi:hypothetical protein